MEEFQLLRSPKGTVYTGTMIWICTVQYILNHLDIHSIVTRCDLQKLDSKGINFAGHPMFPKKWWKHVGKPWLVGVWITHMKNKAYLGIIIPYITQPTRVFFVAHVGKPWATVKSQTFWWGTFETPLSIHRWFMLRFVDPWFKQNWLCTWLIVLLYYFPHNPPHQKLATKLWDLRSLKLGWQFLASFIWSFKPSAFLNDLCIVTGFLSRSPESGNVGFWLPPSYICLPPKLFLLGVRGYLFAIICPEAYLIFASWLKGHQFVIDLVMWKTSKHSFLRAVILNCSKHTYSHFFWYNLSNKFMIFSFIHSSSMHQTNIPKHSTYGLLQSYHQRKFGWETSELRSFKNA